MSKQHLRSGVIFLVLALFPTSGWSQSLRGSLSGIVKDPSGATVPHSRPEARLDSRLRGDDEGNGENQAPFSN